MVHCTTQPELRGVQTLLQFMWLCLPSYSCLSISGVFQGIQGFQKYQEVVWEFRSNLVVLCHHSPRHISLASRQDPLYSDGDLCLYMWHHLLRTLAINTPGLSLLPSTLLPATFASIQLSHSWGTSLAHPHQPHLSCLHIKGAGPTQVPIISGEKLWEYDGN